MLNRHTLEYIERLVVKKGSQYPKKLKFLILSFSKEISSLVFVIERECKKKRER